MSEEVKQTKNDLLKWALCVLFGWFVYEAREIKEDVKTILIQRAAEQAEAQNEKKRNDKQDAELVRIWAILNNDKVRISANNEDEQE